MTADPNCVMFPEPTNSLTDVSKTERVRKALNDPLLQKKPPKDSAQRFDSPKNREPGVPGPSSPLSSPNKKFQFKRIVGVQITPSDLRALVEWKDASKKASWESIRHFSRVNHFLEESGQFNKYFRKKVGRFQHKFISVPPRFHRFCRRSQSPRLPDFQFDFPAVGDPLPNLVSFFSATYFSVSSSVLLKRRIAKKKKIFYYVRNPESVESPEKSEVSSAIQEESLALKDQPLLPDFVQDKSVKDASFQSSPGGQGPMRACAPSSPKVKKEPQNKPDLLEEPKSDCEQTGKSETPN